MKKLLFAVTVALVGCNSISDVTMKEVDDAAKIGQQIDEQWDSLSDEQKHGFVHRFARTLYNVKADVQDAPIPDRYVMRGN